MAINLTKEQQQLKEWWLSTQDTNINDLIAHVWQAAIESTTGSVLIEVHAERKRQDAKWGEQNHPPSVYLMILGEEVGEANKAVLEAEFNPVAELREQNIKNYREELVQVAAVAVAMVECYDRNIKPNLQP